MSPIPTKRDGKRSRSPNTPVSGSTYFALATLPSRTISVSSQAEARKREFSGELLMEEFGTYLNQELPWLDYAPLAFVTASEKPEHDEYTQPTFTGVPLRPAPPGAATTTLPP